MCVSLGCGVKFNQVGFCQVNIIEVIGCELSVEGRVHKSQPLRPGCLERKFMNGDLREGEQGLQELGLGWGRQGSECRVLRIDVSGGPGTGKDSGARD